MGTSPRNAERFGFLAAMQLGDSFFPSGAYAQSYGLEALYRRGALLSAADLAEFVEGQIRWSVGPADGVALLNAVRAARADAIDEVIAIDSLLEAMRIAPELRRASTQTGRRLLTEVSATEDAGLVSTYRRHAEQGTAPGNAAVAWGVIAPALNIEGDVALMAFCHSYATGMVGAALRLMPVSHRDAQSILHGLHSVVVDLIEEISDRHWSTMQSFAPETDIVSMQHEFDATRMFAS